MQTAKQHLSTALAENADVGVEWDQDNQQWWDWYMSLAENASDSAALPLEQLAPPTEFPTPNSADLHRQLAEPFDLHQDQIDSFQREGFIKLKEVVTSGALTLLRRHMAAMFERAGDQLGSRFGSLEMMWLENSIIREFVLSKRLARLAAELLRVSSIRLYHDNGLSKQPGCGRTPWHYDDHHFPIATKNVCTVWIPLQAIPVNMGPLGFAKGINICELVEDIPFNKFDTSYDRKIIERFRERGVQVDISPFDLGEISFHHNMNFHTAGPNWTTIPRMVLATTYFEDGARVIEAPHMVNGDWRRFMPGTEPGEVINTPLNPVLFESIS